MKLKDALALAPMDQCTLRFKSPLRAWWRYGFAWGLMERSLVDAEAAVRCKAYRDAIRMGYLKGTQARLELDAGGVLA